MLRCRLQMQRELEQAVKEKAAIEVRRQRDKGLAPLADEAVRAFVVVVVVVVVSAAEVVGMLVVLSLVRYEPREEQEPGSLLHDGLPPIVEPFLD